MLAELLLNTYAVDVGIVVGHERTRQLTLTLITRHQLRSVYLKEDRQHSGSGTPVMWS